MVEMFDMGGFGSYVWTSYGIAVLCLGWLTCSSWNRSRNASKLLADLQENRPDKESQDSHT